MVAKFFTDLSPTGKKLLAVTMIVLVAALFDRLLIGPTMSRMATIDQEIAKEETDIKGDMHFLGYKNKILKESEVFEPYLVKDADLPAEEEIIASFLKKVENLANKASVTLIKVTPSSGVQEKEYLKYTADLECSGKLADVITFMHHIDTSDDLMKVAKYNFSSKKSDTDELKAVMSVVKIVVGKRPVVATPANAGGDASKSSGNAASASPSAAAK